MERYESHPELKLKLKERACYNQFKKRSGFSFKRIYKQKLKYNEERTKTLRKEYVSIFPLLFNYYLGEGVLTLSPVGKALQI